MARPVTVSIVGNAGPLKKAVDESEGALGRLGGTFSKLGIAAAAGMGAVAAGIGLAAKAAMEDQKSFVLMETAIMNVTGATHAQVKAIDEQIGKMSLATGVADDKLRPAFEALVRGTKDTEQAMKDMSLVLDISTGLQIDQTTVADALAKAYQGNMRGLRALSPEMATMIKEGASLNEVMDVLGGTFGGTAAAAADTFAGRMERLKVFGAELVEQLGYYLLPVVEGLAAFIMNDVIPAFQALVDKYGPKVAEIFQRIGEFIGEKVIPVLRDQLIPFMTELFRVFQEKIIPVVRDIAIKVFEGLSNIFEKVVQKVKDNQNNIKKLQEFFSTAIKFIAEKVAPVLTKVLGVAFDVVGAAIGPVIDVVFALMGAFASLGSFLVKTASFVLDVVGKMVNGVIDVINKAIDGANKLNPFSDIPNIPNVSLGGKSLGSAPTAPTSPGGAAAGIADRLDRMSAAQGMPSITFGGIDLSGDDVEETSGGGGGGGGGSSKKKKRGGASIAPGIASGALAPIGGSVFDPLNPADIEAFLNGQAGTVNITVNTVSADANLPTMIVEALQTYNLQSGPIDVAIAV
jgi:hypothetical protein